MSGSGSAPAASDVFSRLAGRPEAMLAQAIGDVEQIMAGPAIQARCLECPSLRPALPARQRGSLLARLLAPLLG
jgi:protease-4